MDLASLVCNSKLWALNSISQYNNELVNIKIVKMRILLDITVSIELGISPIATIILGYFT